MPLTPFQSQLALLLSQNRTEDSHLAGGAALHSQENSLRYSEDLDFFHDSEVRVASAFQSDRLLLEKNNYTYTIEMNQPGYIRCLVSLKEHSTKVEWAHDSCWRFMPVQKSKELGFVLHPIDLAVNKVLALAGRDEPRDYLDVLYLHDSILSLGALCWAACGKDPGLNPSSLLELLKRRGKYRPEDFLRLNLNIKIDVQELKQKWLNALDAAEAFFQSAPADQLGCLYFSKSKEKFIQPKNNFSDTDIVIHRGQPAGVLPKVF